jgi:hypothetical protein
MYEKLLIDVWHAFKAGGESEVKTMSCACWEIILKGESVGRGDESEFD